METGIVLDIFRCSLHDGPGIRTTVFLKGCPLSCLWCHNPESQARAPRLSFNAERCVRCGACVAACLNGCHAVSSERHDINRTDCKACGNCVAVCPAQALEVKGRRLTAAEVMAEVEKDVDYYRASGGGLTLSGGEPMMQPAFALALARAATDRGIPTVLETCGIAAAEVYRRIMPFIALFLYDYKGTDAALHAAHTGASNERALRNFDRLYQAGARIILRCPLVPGVNDTDEHLAAIAAMKRRYPNLAGIEIMPYHRMGNEKARRAGLAVPLDLPGADSAVKEAWLWRLRDYGCADVTMN